ncbi:AI-2E family transporter [Prosthecomicrobium sp. N25]|uniref:AI-2E family transporter n=1 Tax=Prosthecomicrobium sp. N25 TaxID=3129254 RepID=UPI00307888BD
MLKTPSLEPGDPSNVRMIERFFVVLLFVALLVGVYYVLKPFIVGILFGSIIAIAAWPARPWLDSHGLKSSNLASLLLVLLIVGIVVPAILAAPGLADEMRTLSDRVHEWIRTSPDLPQWISDVPVVGERLAERWRSLMAGAEGSDKLMAVYWQPIRDFLRDAAVGLAASLFQLIVAMVVAATIWGRGFVILAVLRDILVRLGGEPLAAMTEIAGHAVRGVFYGVVGTAAIQGLLMGLGLLVAGVPAAVALGFITMLMALSQIGAPLINLVWIGSAWWLHGAGASSLAFWFVILLGIFVSFADGIIKPALIGAHIHMPIILVVIGVFGGFLSFGFLGLFIGPTLIAIAYSLLQVWRTGTLG